MRKLFAFALFAVSCSAVAQSHFSMDLATMRVSELLPILSKKLGVPLEATAAVGNDVVVVRFKDCSSAEVLGKLAETTYCEWVRDNGVLRLTRPIEKLRAIEKLEVQARARQIKVKLDEMTKAEAASPPWQAKIASQMAEKYHELTSPGHKYDQKEIDYLDKVSPARRAWRQLLPLIGAETLAQVALGHRMVLATKANSLQTPMSSDAEKVIRTLVERQAEYVDVFKRLEPEGTNTSYGAFSPILINGASPVFGRAALAIRALPSGIELRLMISDPDDKTLSEQFETITLEPEEPRPAAQDSPIVLDPLTKKVAEAINARTAEKQHGTMTMISSDGTNTVRFESTPPLTASAILDSELESVILHPDIREPLGLLLDPLITQGIQGNIIGEIPDSCAASLGAALMYDNLTANQIVWTLASAGISTSKSGMWTELQPIFPNTGIQNRAIRKPLAQLLQGINSLGYGRLSQVANFLIQRPRPIYSNDLGACLVSAVSPNAGQNVLPMLANPAMLRVYATLSNQQRAQLLNGGTITLGNLTTNQKQWLIEEIMGSDDGPRVGSQNGDIPKDVYFEPGIKADRTETLLGNIFNSSQLKLRFSSQDAVVGSNGEDNKTLLSAERLAMFQFQDQGNFKGLNKAPSYSDFALARSENYQFILQLNGPVLFERDYDDFVITTDSKLKSVNDLPAAFKTSIQSYFDRMKKSFGGATFNGG